MGKESVENTLGLILGSVDHLMVALVVIDGSNNNFRKPHYLSLISVLSVNTVLTRKE